MTQDFKPQLKERRERESLEIDDGGDDAHPEAKVKGIISSSKEGEKNK